MASAARHPSHPSVRHPDHAHRWGRLVWMDPGAPEVQDHAVRVIEDVVRRYEVDGVHLDDYFYPYPNGARRFPDEATYGAYLSSGGPLPLDAWRRANVDELVHRLAHATRAIRPEVRFGISPFGIYRPGIPEGIRGFDPVDKLHADPMVWYRNGYVDYLAPQLYWPTTKDGQRFGTLLDWWDAQSEAERPLWVGLDFTKVGQDDWTLDEVRAQIELARAAPHTAGWIGFRAAPVRSNQAGLRDLLAALQREPALPPPNARTRREVPPPQVHWTHQGVRVEPAPRRVLVLYASTGDDWRVERIVPGSTESLELPAGRWALSQVDAGGWESPGVPSGAPASRTSASHSGER